VVSSEKKENPGYDRRGGKAGFAGGRAREGKGFGVDRRGGLL